MKDFLLCTTAADKSAELFTDPCLNRGYTLDVLQYDYPLDRGSIVLKKYDIVYFRDPYNVGTYSREKINNTIQAIVESNISAYFIDTIRSIEDINIEDKWIQYEKFTPFMPSTKLLLFESDFIEGKHIIKKRISSRARDVHFEMKSEYLGDEYIFQEILPIKTEYRVYIVNNKILEFISVKTTKSPSSKVKVADIVKITPQLKSYVAKIGVYLNKLDLYGLDIALLDDGTYRLIEVNRSPQFSKYYALSGVNIADELLQAVSKKINQ
jgi:hypothetical protein